MKRGLIAGLIILGLVMASGAQAGDLDQFNLATRTPNFLAQVEVEIFYMANYVRNESPVVTGPCATYGLTAAQCHTARSVLAGSILNSPAQMSQNFALLLASACQTAIACGTTNALVVSVSCGTPPCTYTFTDTDVRNAVNNVYTGYAVQ